MANTQNRGNNQRGRTDTKSRSQSSKSKSSKSTGAKKTSTKTTKSQSTRKNTENGKMYIEREKAQNARRQMSAIILFAVSIFILCVTLIPGGNLWEALQGIIFGLFGVCAFVWPLILLYIAIMTSLDKPIGNIRAKVIEASILVLLICGAVHIFASDGVTTDYFEDVAGAYRTGLASTNGGAFGALIGGLLLMLFASKVPAGITICLFIFVFIMLITGTTLIAFLESLWKPVEKVKEDAGEHFETAARMIEEKREARRFNPDVDLGPEADLSDDKFAPDFDDMPTISAEEKAAAVGTFGTNLDLNSKRGKAAKEAADEPKPVDLSQTEPKPSVLLDDIIKKAAAKNAPADEKPKESEAKPTLADPGDSTHGEGYRLPPPSCLTAPKLAIGGTSEGELRNNAEKLVDVLKSFGVQTSIVDISRGPSVTRYELSPAAGVRISKITGLSDDIALSLAATGVRIEAPIPGKAAVGIEVPNKEREMVTLREIVESGEFKQAKSKLNVALGRDIAGNICMTDIAKMPHLLIAGTTGSGKSVCLNSMILSILYNATPDEVKLVMIDPKQVEFMVYNGIPHLLIPVVSDPHKASGALAWAVKEMLNRYKSFSENNVRDIKGYNEIADMDPDKKRMPQIVIFIDELADLMMAAPNEVEDSICRLAQMARAAGMHLVIATQRPSADVITGLIKANVPSRLSLSVSSAIDSRIILDMQGAEKLLGNGDMLFNPVGNSKPTRIQGCYISDKEVENVVTFIKEQIQTEYSAEVLEEIERQATASENANKKGSGGAISAPGGDDSDEYLPDAIQVVVEAGQASTTLIQRKLKVGYARAARIVDELEERGIVGPFEGSKPRKVLITKNQWLEMNAMSDSSGAEATDSEDY